MRTLLVAALYLPPSTSSDIDGKLENNIKSAYLKNYKMHLIGDFNINYLDSSYTKHRLAKALKSMKFTQLVNSVTRPISSACLDHYYTTHPEFTARVSVLDICLADHLLIIIQLKDSKIEKSDEQKHNTIKYCNMKNLNADEFIRSLENTPWETAFVFDINDIADSLEIMVIWVVDEHMPLKQKRVKNQNQPDWMNDEIIKSIKSRDNLLKRACISNIAVDWAANKHARCKVTNMIKHSKRKFIQQSMEENQGNPTGIWKVLKSSSGNKNNAVTIKELKT